MADLLLRGLRKPKMWTSHLQIIDQQTTKTTLSEGSRVLSFRDVIRLWQDSDDFRSYFTATIGESQFDAFFWETPPVTDRTLDRPIDHACYSHLARFLREAPKSQIGAFWRSAGLAMQKQISASPTWLSTAGMGVSWLHLRLDSRPKYYRYEPYKTHS